MVANNNKGFHVEKIALYKVLQFINNNFVENSLYLEVIDGHSILGTDSRGEQLIFYYDIKSKSVNLRAVS